MLKINPQNNNIQKQQLSNAKNRITPNNNLSLQQDTVSFGCSVCSVYDRNIINTLPGIQSGIVYAYLQKNIKGAYKFLKVLNESFIRSWVKSNPNEIKELANDKKSRAMVKKIMTKAQEYEPTDIERVLIYSPNEADNILDEIGKDPYKLFLCNTLLDKKDSYHTFIPYETMMGFLQSADKPNLLSQSLEKYKNSLVLYPDEPVNRLNKALLVRALKLDKEDKLSNEAGMKVFEYLSKIYSFEEIQSVTSSEKGIKSLNYIFNTTNNTNHQKTDSYFFRIAFLRNILNCRAKFDYNRDERANLETINEIFQKVDADETGNVKTFINNLMENKKILPYISPKDMLEYIDNIDIQKINKLDAETQENIFSIFSHAKQSECSTISGIAYDNIINAQANKNAINMINSELDNISQKESTGFFSLMKKIIPFFSKEEETPTITPHYKGSAEIENMSQQMYKNYVNELFAFQNRYGDTPKYLTPSVYRKTGMLKNDPKLQKSYPTFYKLLA